MDTGMETPIVQLRKLIIGQKSAALPDVPVGSPLEGLRQQLADYDAFVTQAVIRVLGGEKNVEPFPGQAGLDNAFAQADESPVLQQLLRYRQRLDSMLTLARQAATEEPD